MVGSMASLNGFYHDRQITGAPETRWGVAWTAAALAAAMKCQPQAETARLAALLTVLTASDQSPAPAWRPAGAACKAPDMSSSESELSEASQPPSSDEEYEDESEAEAQSDSEEDEEGGDSGGKEGAAADGSRAAGAGKCRARHAFFVAALNVESFRLQVCLPGYMPACRTCRAGHAARLPPNTVHRR